MSRLFAFLLIWSTLPGAALAQKKDHPQKGTTVSLVGEIVSLRCLALDPEKGLGADHSKCAESAIRRGEAAGFLSGGSLYVLLGVSEPKIRPLLLASVREQVTLTGIIVAHDGFSGFSLSGVQSLGERIKSTPPAKKASNKESLKKE